MYISKKKTYKILAYCAMSAIFIGGINGGIASAEDEVSTVEDDVNNSDEVEPTEDKYAQNVETTINENNYSGGNIPSSESSSEDSHKTVTVLNISTTSATEINAGWSSGHSTNNNILIVRNVNAPKAFFHGGYYTGAHSKGDTATDNIIYFYSGNAYEIHGGHAGDGIANKNKVYFIDGIVTHGIGAGYSDYGDVTDNKLNIYGGTINGDVYGGRASYASNSTSGDAIGNFMNISGGTITGTIYGGHSKNGNASDNEINIYGNPNLIDAILIAGEGITVSNNTLKIHTKNLKVNEIYGFENLNFYLPADTQANDTILTVTNSSKQISNKIYVYKDKGFNLSDDATITLITTKDTTNGLNFGEIKPTDENDSDYKKITPVTYTNENGEEIITGLTINAKDIDKTTSIEEIEENKMKHSGFNEENKESAIFNEPVADSVSLLDSGTDRILEWLPPEGVDYMNSSPTAGFDPFVGIGGSKLEINTGNGTELKTKSGGINFGMTRYLKNRHGIFIVAPVVDYGQDSYESTLPDDNKTKGSGNSKYFTAGLIARQVNVNGMYYEASLRYGKIRTDFTSDNFLVNGTPTTASYDASTPCYSGHLRIGWRNHISPQNILDVYGVYSMNRISGFTTKVSTGEDYSFSTVKSGRIRLGARFTREIRERESVYSSLSYIHEFSGETVGEYMGMRTPRSSIKGSAGLIELGWQVKPAKNSVAMLDTSLSWWVGDRKGFTLATKFKKDF